AARRRRVPPRDRPAAAPDRRRSRAARRRPDVADRRTAVPRAAAHPAEGDRLVMLEFDAVSYRYPGAEHATVASVSFTVARGETVALVGPNGSGKTTLVRLASGLLRPGGGSVRIAGVEPTALGPRERARQVAWVPQALEALPPVTVGTFVAA